MPFIAEAAGNTFERRPGVRTWSVDDVLRTLHTTASKALVVPVEGRDGKDARVAGDPLRTMTTRAETALALMPFIAELRGGGSWARSTGDPLATVTASGNHHGLVSLLAPYYSNGNAISVEAAQSTITTVDRHALISPAGGSWNDDARPVADALRALTTRDAYALVMRNNGSKGDGGEHVTPVDEVLRTLTTKGHQTLLTSDGMPAVDVEGESHARSRVRPRKYTDIPGVGGIRRRGSETYEMSRADLARAEELVDDCLFRMLEPHEVAAGMAFPENYRWEGNRRERVRMAGNAVTPPAARDLMAAVAAALTGEDVAIPQHSTARPRPRTQLSPPGSAMGL